VEEFYASDGFIVTHKNLFFESHLEDEIQAIIDKEELIPLEIS
jgi:hypothetical protein